MTPRILLPDAALTELGLPDTSGWAPGIAAARQRLRQAAFRIKSVDLVTTELVRIRNARFQRCFF
jgi:hypothetical protein